MSRNPAGTAFAAIGAILLISSIAALAIMALYLGKACDAPPSPALAQEYRYGDKALAEDDEGFPVVDWDYWQTENPDVIGWITIPGTEIDFPVCQAPEDDPDYYLTHDVHKDWNWFGAVYLDADCIEGGLMDSANAVILGHHIQGGKMFAPVTNYTDREWATSHSDILIQTPSQKERLTVLAADAVNANAYGKTTRFHGPDEYVSWCGETLGESDMKLQADVVPIRMYTLATCSYTTWTNERTLCFAAPATKE